MAVLVSIVVLWLVGRVVLLVSHQGSPETLEAARWHKPEAGIDITFVFVAHKFARAQRCETSETLYCGLVALLSQLHTS